MTNETENEHTIAQTDDHPLSTLDAGSLGIPQSSSIEKIEKIDVAYSSDPWWYDLRGFMILTFAYRTTLPSQIRLFANDMGPNHLEVAVGSGTLLEMVLKWRNWKHLPSVKIVAFDYAERMLAGARKRFKNDKQVSLLRADAAALPLEADQFDSANIANAIHCLPDVVASFKEIHRVLKKDGQLIGNCLLEPRGHGFMDRLSRRINNWGVKKGILNRTYQSSEIQIILEETGFVLDRYEIAGNCLNFVASKVDL